MSNFERFLVLARCDLEREPKLIVHVALAPGRVVKSPTVLVSVRRVDADPSGAIMGHVRAVRLDADRRRYAAVLDGIRPGSYRVWCGSPTTAVVVEVGAVLKAVTLTLR